MVHETRPAPVLEMTVPKIVEEERKEKKGREREGREGESKEKGAGKGGAKGKEQKKRKKREKERRERKGKSESKASLEQSVWKEPGDEASQFPLGRGARRAARRRMAELPARTHVTGQAPQEQSGRPVRRRRSSLRASLAPGFL